MFLPKDYKRISGYENYAINPQGMILSLSRRMWNGHIYWQSKNRILKQTIAQNGYLVVGFTKNCKTNLQYIHKLLTRAFISNPNDYKCTNHKDGNKLNNDLNNLEWCSYKQNSIHAFRNGLMPIGEKHHNSKITNKDADYIRKFKGKRNGMELVKMFNLSSAEISRIKNNKRRGGEKIYV